MIDTLQQIRDLQFSDRERAEDLLLSFLRSELELDAMAVRLTPRPTSLNSFNGFVTLSDGVEKFFKTHTETHTVIHEYYNAEMLADAGYPIIQPTFRSGSTGRQILLYDVIHDEAVFDVAWQIEHDPSYDMSELRIAQENEDKALYQRYEQTLQTVPAEQNVVAPIHQLFWHRLTGGRLASFYSGNITLPNVTVPLAEVLNWSWNINGQRYDQSLQQIIAQATALLNPAHDTMGIIGHGDAHNGNVFLQTHTTEPSLLYFDPAFAGRHDPLADLAKPLFHNVFAMWMYFPQEIAAKTPVIWQRQGTDVTVTYDYLLPAVRHLFLDSKVRYTLLPVLQLLHRRHQLRPDWRAYLKAALFCCPFLTMNLSDPTRFPASIALLGLAMSIEMGAESLDSRSVIDQALDDIEKQL